MPDTAQSDRKELEDLINLALRLQRAVGANAKALQEEFNHAKQSFLSRIQQER